MAKFTKHFPIGCLVRYKPGSGTYGYEDALEDDGRVAGKVLGYSDTRVRVELALTKRSAGCRVIRCVDAGSLTAV